MDRSALLRWSFVATLLLSTGACGFTEQGLALPSDQEHRPTAGGGAHDGAAPSRAGGLAAAGRENVPTSLGDAAAPAPDVLGATDPDGDGGGTIVSPQADAAPVVVTPPPSPDAAPEPPASDTCPVGDGTLLLCLRFEDTVVDESEPRAEVTASGLAYEPGITRQAGHFRPPADVQVAAAAGLGNGPFTIEAWVHPRHIPAPGQRAGIVDRDLHFGLFLHPGGDLVCSHGVRRAVAPGAIPAGQWSAVACTASADAVVLYVGGVARATATAGPGLGLLIGRPVLAIGRNSPVGDAFQGLIDNVRLWSVARTPAQICASTLGCD